MTCRRGPSDPPCGMSDRYGWSCCGGVMLSQDAIVRAVRSIRFASKQLRNSRRVMSVNALAKHAGISRDTVYSIASTGKMSRETADKLRSVLGPVPVPLRPAQHLSETGRS